LQAFRTKKGLPCIPERGWPAFWRRWYDLLVQVVRPSGAGGIIGRGPAPQNALVGHRMAQVYPQKSHLRHGRNSVRKRGVCTNVGRKGK
jgi:hypothetical protein